MKKILLPILLALLLAACDQTGAQRDAVDEQDPRVRSGLEQVHLQNWDKAIAQFEKALAKNPDLARPDLELALIYHQRKNDYIKAIYHYQRYLEKRPATEKRQLILDW
ncbi:MAG: tetratricopeptide repeat protein, partial [Kiritimatiellales bacterium]